VVLEDHHTDDEINAGMAGSLGFEGTFNSFEETGEDLDGLRSIFRRKAFVSRQERLCRMLLADGYAPAELAGMRLEDVPSSEAKQKYLSRREELGLDVSEGPVCGGSRRQAGSRRGGREAPAVREGDPSKYRGERRLLQGSSGRAQQGRGRGRQTGGYAMKAARLHRYDDRIPRRASRSRR